jgi:hypothetical protein
MANLLSRLTTLVIWCTWAALALISVHFVYRYSLNIPSCDEYELIPALTGHESADFHWLWAQHNEHRIPVPKAILYLLAQCTHGDSRAGAYLNVFVLIILAATMIRMAQRLRGRSCLCDLFFPLALLHEGHYQNMVWSFQVQFMASSALLILMLLLLFQDKGVVNARSAKIAGVCLIGLIGCGSNGLAAVPPLAIGWGTAGIFYACSGVPVLQKSGRILLVAAMLAFFAVGLYVINYQFAEPPSLQARQCLRCALQFMTMAIGPVAERFWPLSAFALMTLGIASLALILRAWHMLPLERARILVLCALIAAVAAVAMAVGWGRGSTDSNAGFTHRYALLAVPWLCAVYFLWQIYAPPGFAHAVQGGLMIALVIALPGNNAIGRHEAKIRLARMDPAERDLREGYDPRALAIRHGDYLYPPNSDVLAGRLEMLRLVQYGPYRARLDMTAEKTITAMPLASLEEPPQIVMPFELWGKRLLRQKLPSSAIGYLFELDVQFVTWNGRGRNPDTIDWCLEESTPAGIRLCQRQGQLNAGELQDWKLVRLKIDPPLLLGRSSGWYLVLKPSPGTLQNQSVGVPLYATVPESSCCLQGDGAQVAGVLGGWIYYQPSVTKTLKPES